MNPSHTAYRLKEEGREVRESFSGLFLAPPEKPWE